MELFLFFFSFILLSVVRFCGLLLFIEGKEESKEEERKVEKKDKDEEEEERDRKGSARCLKCLRRNQG